MDREADRLRGRVLRPSDSMRLSDSRSRRGKGRRRLFPQDPVAATLRFGILMLAVLVALQAALYVAHVAGALQGSVSLLDALATVYPSPRGACAGRQGSYPFVNAAPAGMCRSEAEERLLRESSVTALLPFCVSALQAAWLMASSLRGYGIRQRCLRLVAVAAAMGVADRVFVGVDLHPYFVQGVPPVPANATRAEAIRIIDAAPPRIAAPGLALSSMCADGIVVACLLFMGGHSTRIVIRLAGATALLHVIQPLLSVTNSPPALRALVTSGQFLIGVTIALVGVAPLVRALRMLPPTKPERRPSCFRRFLRALDTCATAGAGEPVEDDPGGAYAPGRRHASAVFPESGSSPDTTPDAAASAVGTAPIDDSVSEEEHEESQNVQEGRREGVAAMGMANDAQEVMNPSPLPSRTVQRRPGGPLQRLGATRWLQRLRCALDARVHSCLGFVNVEVRLAKEGHNAHGFLPLPATMLRATVRELPEECNRAVYFPSRVQAPRCCRTPYPARACTGASADEEGAKAASSSEHADDAAGTLVVETAAPSAAAGTVPGGEVDDASNDDGVPCHATLVVSAWSAPAPVPVPEAEVVAERVHAGPPSPSQEVAAPDSGAKVQARRAYTNTAFVRGYFSTVLIGAAAYFLLLLLHVLVLQLYRSGVIADWHTNHLVHVLVLMIKLIAYPAALMYVWLSSLERVTALLVGEQLAREAASRVEQQRLFLRYVCHEVRRTRRAGMPRECPHPHPHPQPPSLSVCSFPARFAFRSTRWSWAWRRSRPAC